MHSVMPKMLRRATEPPKIQIASHEIDVEARVRDIVREFGDDEAPPSEDSSDFFELGQPGGPSGATQASGPTGNEILITHASGEDVRVSTQ